MYMGLPRWLSGKQPACQTGDAGSIPGSGRIPGEGNGNLLQYSCLENPTDRGAYGATVHVITESDRTEHTCACTHTHTQLNHFAVHLKFCKSLTLQ